MIEEDNSNKKKKKVIIEMTIAVVFLIVLVIGATYGFFSFTNGTSQSTTEAIIETGDASLISLTGGTKKLHITVDADDMSGSNAGKIFYATSDSSKKYLEETDDYIFNLAKVTVDGILNDSKDCTADLEVTLTGDLKDVLQPGDTLLHVEGMLEELNVDLATIKEESPKTYTLELPIAKNLDNSIDGYLKLTNRYDDQTYVAGKQLNVSLTVKNLKCYTFNTAAEYVAKNPQIETIEHMQEREGDTLRRFQGIVENDNKGTITNDINNYICFGTSDTATCTSGTDKYMYRVIGIDTETNELKLIKKEALDTGTKIWGNDNRIWMQSDLQIALNSDFYLYTLDNNWGSIISFHDWGYGDVLWNDNSGITSTTTSLQAYQIEQKAMKSGDNHGILNAKIGLMYMSDYWLSAGINNLNCHTVTNTPDYTCLKSWLYLKNNDSASLSTTNKDPLDQNEWTMSRASNLHAWYVNGMTPEDQLRTLHSVRPVFYLKSDVRIIEGNGTKEKPYIIEEPPLLDAEDVILASIKIESAEHMNKRTGDTLRRYQGQVTTVGATITNDIDNYICFGTTDPIKCTEDTDKYMYRIIGIDITNDQIKLIKREALNEAQAWGENNQTWADSPLQLGLNGDLFLKAQSTYEYMQDGNTETKWTKIILPHDWEYGDVPYDYDTGFYYSTTGIQAYQNEQTAIKNGDNHGILTAKIGLMYPSDYWLSGTSDGGEDNLQCESAGQSYGACLRSWMHITNNDSANLSTTKLDPPGLPVNFERIMLRRDGNGSVWHIAYHGGIDTGGPSGVYAVRPVFYIKSNFKLSGKGTLSNPYILDGVEN